MLPQRRRRTRRGAPMPAGPVRPVSAAFALVLGAAGAGGCGAGGPLEEESLEVGLAEQAIVLPDPLAVQVQGVLSRLSVGSVQSAGGSEAVRYVVADSERVLHELAPSTTISESALASAVGRRVTASGRRRTASGALIVTTLTVDPAPAFLARALTAPSEPRTLRWLTVPCTFSDLPQPAPQSPAYLESLMGAAPPGMTDYFRAASLGKIQLESTVVSPRPMPRVASAYGLQTPSEDLAELVTDCFGTVLELDLDLDLASFAGFSFAFSHNLDAQLVAGSFGGEAFFNVLSPVELAHQASVARVFGKTLGLTFSGTAAGRFDSPWDVMSRGFAMNATNTACASLTPSFGCAAVLPAAEHGAGQGWLPAAQVVSAGVNALTTVDLDFNGRAPQVGHVGLLRVPLDANHYLTVEARQKASDGYERGVPFTGLVFHQMDTTPAPDDTAASSAAFSTRLRFLEATALTTGRWSGSGVAVDFQLQQGGYRVQVDRRPPPPKPEPDPEPEEDDFDCFTSCARRGTPAYKCQQICGEDVVVCRPPLVNCQPF